MCLSRPDNFDAAWAGDTSGMCTLKRNSAAFLGGNFRAAENNIQKPLLCVNAGLALMLESNGRGYNLAKKDQTAHIIYKHQFPSTAQKVLRLALLGVIWSQMRGSLAID